MNKVYMIVIACILVAVCVCALYLWKRYMKSKEKPKPKPKEEDSVEIPKSPLLLQGILSEKEDTEETPAPSTIHVFKIELEPKDEKKPSSESRVVEVKEPPSTFEFDEDDELRFPFDIDNA